ncbi:hypothetical protein ACFE04_023615 [Oxalis oulophora]
MEIEDVFDDWEQVHSLSSIESNLNSSVKDDYLHDDDCCIDLIEFPPSNHEVPSHVPSIELTSPPPSCTNVVGRKQNSELKYVQILRCWAVTVVAKVRRFGVCSRRVGLCSFLTMAAVLVYLSYGKVRKIIEERKRERFRKGKVNVFYGA